MKTELFLDYQTVLANKAAPVHFAVRFHADEVVNDRPQPAAFCIVLDRSSSMDGEKLTQARKATELAVRNLRRNDLFGLVVFDDKCQTVVPLQTVMNRQEVLSLINRIDGGGSTNLTGGWMLGRDELKKAPDGVSRRLLLLSDGQLNVGIVEPVAVNQIVASGLEQDRIRTSCLGFGEGYNEDLMAEMARVTGGQFYDAQSPEQLPAIFTSELEGLQKLAVQNLRLRIKPLDFCEQIALLGNYPVLKLPDGRYELAMGDLMSDEERVVCFALEVLPLPCIEGQPVASLAGEKVLEVEFQYDELMGQSVHSRTESQVVRIQATANPDEVKVNEEVVSWVALQRAGQVAEGVTKKIDQGDLKGAETELKATIDRLKKYGAGTGTADAIRLLSDLVQRLEQRSDIGVTRKSARYYSSSLGRMSSSDAWTGSGPPPGFKQKHHVLVTPSSTPADIPDNLVAVLRRARRVTVLTGAGISAESGIPTFRDQVTGFWANYDPQKLATSEGFKADPALVTRWYDERRLQCAAAKPNPGHVAIAELEKWYESRGSTFTLITQTVDRLHQAAGSQSVVELHGTLWLWRCIQCGQEQEERGGSFPSYPLLCACGGMRRPSVVWFGEELPAVALRHAEITSGNCDIFLSIGTSGRVYPAALLAKESVRSGACLVEVNPIPTALTPTAHWALTGNAGVILPFLVQQLQ
jgi:NAD-dependent SIR2 family protein deacetylase